ncbi:Lrp/AsnC family transcriptional regulator [Rhodococcus opacus]|uniref:Putative AsnC family transcriptional regulator n=1 Tax=Rhodococcus opacus (strain B4) TaxID=632772 RepID=C1B657_RHOOB|nr:Lrp/AsnC family transcriptional regulator [Rhodococcus opacus]BAH55468.1 putative AsnC family transcriptional regulator [Rhodococcus opacus B4]
MTTESKNTELDRIDRALLRALSVNARASGATLAQELAVSESTLSLRLRRLQSLQIIRGFRVDIDLAALGTSLQALVAVRLATHNRQRVVAFQESALHIPGVLGIFHITGADDFLLHVVAKNAQELRDVVIQNLIEQNVVARAESSLIFDYAEADGWKKLLD